MKKLLSIVIVLIMTTITARAQGANSTKVIQKITTGAIVGTVASTTFSGAEQPFSLGYNLSVNVTIVTPKTYHNTMYAFGGNSLVLLNGYFLPKQWDTYIKYSKQLHTGNQYLGVGVAKIIKVEGVKFLLFSETGTNFNGTQSLSFGVLTSLQNQLWKRK